MFRARDSKLNRDVALKLLPDAFAFDPDRLARFGREARALAALNHPHIAAIYGLEESDGRQALVLQLVEGVTLAERIASRCQSGRPWRLLIKSRERSRRPTRKGSSTGISSRRKHRCQAVWPGQGCPGRPKRW